MFINEIKKTLVNNDNYAVTDNGALGYRTTGSNLLDLNFSVTSLRNESDKTIIDKFLLAYAENRELALKWLFYIRDIRGGLGERRTFRVITYFLFDCHKEEVSHLIPYFAEYGRYDDLIPLVDTASQKEVVDFLVQQLMSDIVNKSRGQSISLLAKWMPSINASSVETKRLGKKLAKLFVLSEKEYRQMLSELRGYLKVLERDMSAKKWDKIDYPTVPSRANNVYKDAFLRNDPIRRREFLSKLEKGEVKINAGTLFPHEIYAKCPSNGKDATLEGLWKALPSVPVENSTLVVCDGSGSMECYINNSVQNIDISRSLAIYFAERLQGEFANKFLTFSGKTELVSLIPNGSLSDNKRIMERYNDYSNTDIEKVFKVILNTAIRSSMSQEDMPKNVLIISDMQFDCIKGSRGQNQRLFDTISNDFNRYGYKLPRLIFWNLNGKGSAIPMIDSETGAVLIGGYSPNAIKMVMSNKTDPYECLVDTLMSKRYELITLNK